MSGTIAPTSPTAAWVDATGIHAPSYADIVDYLVAQYQYIYGEDIVVTPDSQDGQLIGVFALAISDANAACIAAYNAFSPATAQGVGLSSMVKINGMARALPSNSSVLLLLEGVVGTVINNGVVADSSSNRWNLPASVTIPSSGQITVTALADTPGDIIALPDTITRIMTVTRGWQTVTNPTAAVPGAPIETDASLRLRQSRSTAMPSRTVLSGITGAVLALSGVTACQQYENDTNMDYTTVTPPLGIDPLPPHSIALVVIGGDATEICQTILMHKTPGCYTYGTTRNTVLDNYGLAHDIGFFIPTPVTIHVTIHLKARVNYTTQIGRTIATSVANYINGLGSGEDIVWSKLWLPANLCDAQGRPIETVSDSFDITQITVARMPGVESTTNVPIDIFEIATCDVDSGVTIVVS